jgi:hypothetical protein
MSEPHCKRCGDRGWYEFAFENRACPCGAPDRAVPNKGDNMSERKNVERILVLNRTTVPSLESPVNRYECGGTSLVSPHFDCTEVMVTIVPRESEDARKRRLKLKAIREYRIREHRIREHRNSTDPDQKLLDQLEAIDRGEITIKPRETESERKRQLKQDAFYAHFHEHGGNYADILLDKLEAIDAFDGRAWSQTIDAIDRGET